MALKLANLENHGGSGAGLKLWSYNDGTDNRAAITGTGYFNGAASLLSVGDRIFVHASDTDFDCHVSAVSAAGAVTVAAIDAFSA